MNEYINTAFFITQAQGHLVKGGDLLKESGQVNFDVKKRL